MTIAETIARIHAEAEERVACAKRDEAYTLLRDWYNVRSARVKRRIERELAEIGYEIRIEDCGGWLTATVCETRIEKLLSQRWSAK